MSHPPNTPGLIRLPQPLMEMDASTNQDRDQPTRSKARSRRRANSKPKRKNPPAGGQQGQDEVSSQNQSQPNFRDPRPQSQPLPQASISNSATKAQPPKNSSYQNNYKGSNNSDKAMLQQRQPVGVGGGGVSYHHNPSAAGLLPTPRLPPIGQGARQRQLQDQQGSAAASWRTGMTIYNRTRQGQVEGQAAATSSSTTTTSSSPKGGGGTGVMGSKSKSTQPKPRPTFHAPIPFNISTNTPPPISYSRVFYTMMDYPNLSARREPVFVNYQKLSLNDQLVEMQAALSLTPEAQHQRLKILDDILSFLRKEYPFCRIYPFGSYLTGLGDSTSDVDLYVDAFGVTVGEKLPRAASTTLDVLERIFRSLRRANCLNSNKALCKHIVPIREARVPILKLTHWSNVNIDLSFENLTSLRNSEMISLYMRLDPCVKPLMVLIRFWARFHGLTGSNNIKNYCLILMVLVLLTSKKVVPSVEALQKLREFERKQSPPGSKDKDKNSDIIDGWDTGFAKFETITSRLMSPNSSIAKSEFGGDLSKAVLSLARDFFDMFGNLDFSSCVVCTKTAEILEVGLFKPGNEEDLPYSLEKYKDWAVQQPLNRRLNIWNPLCVQDPFILSFNVGAVTPFTTLFKFQVACRETAAILENYVPLPSLLDLFIPLPKEVGDRKFLNMQEKQRETIKLKEDINYFLESGQFPPEVVVDEVNGSSEESLGLHRLPLKEIIDKNSIRFGKGWESLSFFLPSDDFQNLFADTIISHKLHKEHSTRFLFEKLKQLWLSFLDDFLEEFWTKCFLLEVNQEEREMADRMYANSPFGPRNRKNYELIFTERRKRSNKQNETIPPEREDCLLLDQKLAELGNIQEKILCRRLTCSALLPIWQKRTTFYNEIMNHLYPSTTKDGEDDRPRSRRRQRKPLTDTDNINPLDIQKRVTQTVKEELELLLETTPKPLKFAVFIKIDSSFVDDIPSMSIVCEKVKDTHVNLYNQGVAIMMETLNDVFDPYCMYRLQDWLNPNNRKRDSSTSSSPELFVNDAEDFDSLMPPTPSSSECSSPVWED